MFKYTKHNVYVPGIYIYGTIYIFKYICGFSGTRLFPQFFFTQHFLRFYKFPLFLCEYVYMKLEEFVLHGNYPINNGLCCPVWWHM